MPGLFAAYGSVAGLVVGVGFISRPARHEDPDPIVITAMLETDIRETHSG